MSAKLVLITAPRGEKAQLIAKTLVQENLAACVNIVTGIRSIYAWQGKIEDESEDLLVVKTIDKKLTALEKRLLEIHPYSTPEFVVIKPEHMSSAYSKWLTDVLEG